MEPQAHPLFSFPKLNSLTNKLKPAKIKSPARKMVSLVRRPSRPPPRPARPFSSFEPDQGGLRCTELVAAVSGEERVWNVLPRSEPAKFRL